MATRWTEAVPLRITTAKAVAKASIEIFSERGYP